MMRPSRMSWTELLVPVALLLLLGLYVGSYLMLVEPAIMLSEAGPTGNLESSSVADYAYGEAWASYAFAPLEWLDRTLLPSRWQCEVEILPSP